LFAIAKDDKQLLLKIIANRFVDTVGGGVGWWVGGVWKCG